VYHYGARELSSHGIRYSVPRNFEGIRAIIREEAQNFILQAPLPRPRSVVSDAFKGIQRPFLVVYAESRCHHGLLCAGYSMLSELTISNFAIIERQSLSFHQAFNVISGETGAGKSIILNALEFILGGKASPTVIRTGADQMEVQALFDLSDVPAEIRAELPDIVGEDDELVVSRTLPREGRGKVLINGRLGTVSLLEEIVRKLVNICSQHHHTRLLDPRFHVELLDGFCGCSAQVEQMRTVYKGWNEKRSELEELREAHSKGAARREELEQVLAELAELENLKPGRRAELENEIKRISNFERLMQAGQRALDVLAAEEGVTSSLKEVGSALQEIERLDPSAATLAEEFEAAREALAESEIALDRYVAGLDFDAEVLESLRTELSELARLERKYRLDDAGLCELKGRAERELSALNGGPGFRELEQEVESLHAKVLEVGQALRTIRKKGARELCGAVASDLKELNMRDASLEVRFSEIEPTVSGLDRIEFLMATNKGEPHAALHKIASGGELSRVMLVLKKILRERSGVNVLIFDEVDTGISGGVARSVGKMLKEISGQSQVICITHLPQVASLSDRHFLVNKEVGERAITVVKQLSDEEKVDEIARMLAGYTITEASRASARELIASK
jgi:DNA repair protein RecN (Recombination protein N)